MKFPFFSRDSFDIAHYQRYRAAGKRLISKLYDAAKGSEYDLFKAAKKLTIPVEGQTLIVDGKTGAIALADFYLHEMRVGSRRIVDVLAESGADLTGEERELLAAHRSSRCSLFSVVKVDPDACQLQLRDLLETAAPDVLLTDIDLSHSLIRPGDLLFLRVIECAGIQMGYGFFFAFSAAHRVHLLNAYAARMRTVEEKEREQRRYIFFYKKHRELGIGQAYKDIV